MSFPVTPAILDTVLDHLAPHFLVAAKGDLSAARDAAGSMLAAYDVQTEEELHLATDIVSFGFHALEALGAAAAPDLSLNQRIRLRGSAVSMNREAHKARQRLDQLKRARQAEPALSADRIAPADEAPPADLMQHPQRPVPPAARPNGFKAWTMSHQQRRAAERITETLRRNKAEHERQLAAASATLVPAPTTTQPAHA